jgi:hypothetical protein
MRFGDIISLTGKFYRKKGFPYNYQSEQMPEKARVFHYISYGVMKVEKQQANTR